MPAGKRTEGIWACGLCQDRLRSKKLGTMTPFARDHENILSDLPVLLCFDSGYARFAAVATFSAHAHLKSDIKFYWLTTTDVVDLANRLKAILVSLGLNISIVSVDAS